MESASLTVLNGEFVLLRFDLKGLDPNVPEDVTGIKAAAEKSKIN